MAKHYSRVWRHKGAIIRRRGDRYQAEINQRGTRHRHTEDSLAAAKTYIDQKIIELGNLGLSAHELSPAQRIDAATALKELDGAASLAVAVKQWKEARELLQRRVPLQKAARFWVSHNEARTSSKALSELLDEYVEARTRGNLREASLKEIRNKVGNFVKAFAKLQPHMLTPKDIKGWLDNNTPSMIGWKKHKTLIKVFFDYLLAEEYIDSNPAAELRPSVKDAHIKQIERYTADEAKRLMEATLHEAPAAVPLMAIGLFAGLRPSEADRLDWSNVNFRTKRIKVTSETAKRRRSRSVHMEPNLISWLLPYSQDSGPVGPSDSYFRRLRPKIVKAAGIEKWLHDGLRHTYGSMHVEKHQDPAKTAHQMGHRDLRVLYDHYVDAVDGEEEAQIYWSISPKNDSGVIRLPMASSA